MPYRHLCACVGALCIAGSAVVGAPSAFAVEPGPHVRQEVGALLDTVARSHCQFNRNGNWYDSEAARDHLRKKYDYLVKKHLIATTEDFIERAATSSSISGQAYRIACPGAAAVDSALWLTDALGRLRRQR